MHLYIRSERSIQSAKRVQSAGTSRGHRQTPMYEEFHVSETSLSRRRREKTPPTPSAVIKSLYGTIPAATSSKITATSIGKVILTVC